MDTIKANSKEKKQKYIKLSMIFLVISVISFVFSYFLKNYLDSNIMPFYKAAFPASIFYSLFFLRYIFLAVAIIYATSYFLGSNLEKNIFTNKSLALFLFALLILFLVIILFPSYAYNILMNLL
jgi:hypothetical protein